jgi:hypothetical protein
MPAELCLSVPGCKVHMHAHVGAAAECKRTIVHKEGEEIGRHEKCAYGPDHTPPCWIDDYGAAVCLHCMPGA